MAASGSQRGVRGPPPGLSFSLDEWVPCEAYLGRTRQRESDTAANGDLERIVARLHGRHERNNSRAVYTVRRAPDEVYVKILLTGLVLRVMKPSINGQTDDGSRDGDKEFFETVQIARCSANHEPCPRALIWVYNRQSHGGFAEDGSVECHGVMCRDLQDATRLANTLAMAFYEMRSVAIANAFGAVGGAMAMPQLARSMPLESPPAYTVHDGVMELPPRRNRNHARQSRVLQIATVHDDDGEDDQLDLFPRSPGPRSPQATTPRNTTSTSFDSSTVSLNSPDDDSPRGKANVSMRNSVVSLHSTAAVSEGSRIRRGRQSTGLPDVDAGYQWESSNV